MKSLSSLMSTVPILHLASSIWLNSLLLLFVTLGIGAAELCERRLDLGQFGVGWLIVIIRRKGPRLCKVQVKGLK